MRRDTVLAADPTDAVPSADHGLARARPFRRLRLAGRFACAAGLITTLVLAAHDRATAPLPPVGTKGWSDPVSTANLGQSSAVRAAVPVASAGPLLRLDGPAEPAPRSEPARWNPASGLREDALSQGGFDAIEAPYWLVIVTDAAQAPETETGLFVTLARRAADGRGLAVTRTGGHGEIATKFGPMETVDATLSGDGTRLCTGFRTLGPRAVRLDGWLCGILGQAPEPREVSCALDRLILAGPAASTVEAAFTEAGTRRDPACRVAEASAAGDATGSIEPPKREGRKRVAKNEAVLRRNAQAQR